MGASDRRAAAAANLRVGDVFAEGSSGRLVRVLHIDPVVGSVWCMALGGGKPPVASPLLAFGTMIARRELAWTSDHSFKRRPPPRALPVEATGKATRNGPRFREAEDALVARHWAMIAPLCTAARDGSLYAGYAAAISARADEVNQSRTTVGRVFRTWLEFGMTDASLGSARHLCGGKGKERVYADAKPGRARQGKPDGVPLNPGTKLALDWGVKWLRANPFRPRVHGFIAMNNEHFDSGKVLLVGDVEVPAWIDPHLRPTESQFHRYVRKRLPEGERQRSRRGEKNYRNNVAPVFGTTSGRSFQPGSISHLDSTPVAIGIVDTKTRTVPLGQPRLYLQMDDFSSVITAKAMSFSAELTEDALLAVADSMVGYIRAPRTAPGRTQQPDVEKFKTSEGFTDKGGSYLSDLNNAVQQRMGSLVSNPEGGMPSHRGKGEQRFNMLRSFLDWLPGALSKRRRGRGDARRGGDAALTMDEFGDVVEEFILFHNSTHRPEQAPPESFLPDGRPRTAFDLMLWGFANRGAPDRCEADEVRLCLYPQLLATVDGRQGLLADGINYKVVGQAPRGLDFTGSGGRAKGTWVLLRDPKRIGNAWLLTDGGTATVELEAIGGSRDYAELSAVEWQALRQSRSAAERGGREEQLLQIAASNSVLDGIVRKAVKLKGSPAGKAHVGRTRDEEDADLREAARAQLAGKAMPPAPATHAEPPEPRPRAAAWTDDDDDVEDFRSLNTRLQDRSAQT